MQLWLNTLLSELNSQKQMSQNQMVYNLISIQAQSYSQSVATQVEHQLTDTGKTEEYDILYERPFSGNIFGTDQMVEGIRGVQRAPEETLNVYEFARCLPQASSHVRTHFGTRCSKSLALLTREE